eukprot:scaffold1015_cov31-Phaeocystis_antarctica.AAC.1
MGRPRRMAPRAAPASSPGRPSACQSSRLVPWTVRVSNQDRCASGPKGAAPATTQSRRWGS